MLVCDVSAIDRLIDMYGENLSVFYKQNKYKLYDLRDEFVDNSIQCSLDDYIPTSHGIRQKSGDEIIIFIDPHQSYTRDDVIGI